MKQDRTFLIHEIENAFRDTLKPSAITEGEQGLEHVDCQQVFQGNRWEQVPDQSILDHVFCLIYITEEAQVYYIPAFMRTALRYMADSDDFGWTICSDLVSGSFLTLNMEEKLPKLPLFNQRQRKAIHDFLLVCAESPSANQIESDLSRRSAEAWLK